MIVYLIMGVLLMNGMPHFTAGSGGQIFRTPWRRYAPPRMNVMYGLANFVVVAVLAVVKLSGSVPQKKDLVFLFIGAAIGIAMFGMSASRFFDDRDPAGSSLQARR